MAAALRSLGRIEADSGVDGCGRPPLYYLQLLQADGHKLGAAIAVEHFSNANAVFDNVLAEG